MDIKSFLNNVCNEIKYKPIRNDISEELENHIIDIKQNYIDEGTNEEQAEIKAVEQMGNPKEIGIKLNKIHKPKLDWKLFIIMIILLGFSFLVAFTRAKAVLIDNGEISIITRYILFFVMGLVFSVLCYFADYKKILKHSNFLYLLAIVIIILTLTFGAPVNGIPHLRIGTYMFSASVIAMPLFILSFVGFIEMLNNENKIKFKYLGKEKSINLNYIKLVLSSLFSLFLFTLIPATATAIIVCISYFIILTAKIIQSNTNIKRNLAILWGIPIIFGLLFTALVLIRAPYTLYRITGSFNPESDPQGVGWIGVNQKLIINSANIYGEADDMSNALNIFDEGTNYAFISILAHYGWIIGTALILTIILFSIRLIINAIKIKDIYGKNIIIGISSMFILQCVFNLLMNLNLGLQADFNIPFISYGGASLIINMICISLILSVYRRKDILINEKDVKMQINNS